MAMSQGNNPWFASTMGLAGLILGYVIATTVQGGITFGGGNVLPPTDGGQQASQGLPPTTNTPPEAGVGPVIGNDDATVTVIEFTDFQCPFCQRHYQQTFGQIKTAYVDTGKIKYETRHFPLSFHPNAQKASEAAACAEDQGKFWEMHGKLFDTQNEWANLDAAGAATAFKKYATELGVKAAAFNTCFDGGSKAKEVQDDIAAGSQSGIDGTPGFWILGPDDQKQLISGAYPFATFQSAIDGMLK